MPTISTLLRWFGAVCLVCLVALGLVVWLVPHSVQGDPTIVGVHCDDRGGIDSVLVDVPHGGRVTLAWDNRANCGRDDT